MRLAMGLGLGLGFRLCGCGLCRCFLLMSRLPMRLHGQGFCLSLRLGLGHGLCFALGSRLMLCLLLHGQVRECLILPVFQCLAMALAMVVAILVLLQGCPLGLLGFTLAFCAWKMHRWSSGRCGYGFLRWL